LELTIPNEEHLTLINQGVDAWNKWREEHVDTSPDLSKAQLGGANFSGANLSEANLERASLVETSLENANLNGCRIYGISAWNIRVNPETKQSDLIITQPDEATQLYW
jgi:hypothetical protein